MGRSLAIWPNCQLEVLVFDFSTERKPLLLLMLVFIGCFFLPVEWLAGSERLTGALWESLYLVRWYAQEHVLLCLVPAFFIAGAISVFVSQGSVMKYLGARANKVLAYGVASVSGSILAVCSCTVLPLFGGIYRMGAGLGPATAFLYAGPAINILAIILTARILGFELGVARTVGAILFSVVIGLLMHFIFRKEEMEKANAQIGMPEPEVKRPLWQNGVFFGLMVLVLVFANWGAPNDWNFRLVNGMEFHGAIVSAPQAGDENGGKYVLKSLAEANEGAEIVVDSPLVESKVATPSLWTTIWNNKWIVTSVLAAIFGFVLVIWFRIAWWKVAVAGVPAAVLAFLVPSGGMWVLVPFTAGTIGLSVITATREGESSDWFSASWGFAKQILPLLMFGVIVAGFLLGRPGHEGMIPSEYIKMLLGDSPDAFLQMTGLAGSSLEPVIASVWDVWTNLFASVFAAFMYFATLTEVPILEGLIGSGMGKGPALALLLAGPALSLPNMLVIRSIMGTKKTVVFVSLVVVMATISGIVYGAL
jgi:uncharacterized membrane protein YraQ (UPF0718 family)